MHVNWENKDLVIINGYQVYGKRSHLRIGFLKINVGYTENFKPYYLFLIVICRW